MAFDYTDTLERYSESIVITRRGPGTFVNGRYQPDPAFQEIPIDATVQPLGFRELMILSEGERAKAKYALWTLTKLQTIADPDQTVYQGITYEIHDTKNWVAHGDYFKYLMIKIENQPVNAE